MQAHTILVSPFPCHFFSFSLFSFPVHLLMQLTPYRSHYQGEQAGESQLAMYIQPTDFATFFSSLSLLFPFFPCLLFFFFIHALPSSGQKISQLASQLPVIQLKAQINQLSPQQLISASKACWSLSTARRMQSIFQLKAIVVSFLREEIERELSRQKRALLLLPCCSWEPLVSKYCSLLCNEKNPSASMRWNLLQSWLNAMAGWLAHPICLSNYLSICSSLLLEQVLQLLLLLLNRTIQLALLSS